MVLPALVASVVALAILTGPAAAAGPADQPRPIVPPPALTDDEAEDALTAHPRVRAWLARYPPNPVTRATFGAATRVWTVKVWSGEAGQIAAGRVADDGRVLEAWTGPQVAWTMARGRPGAFGGPVLLRWPVWVAISAVFVLGLADLRRPFALRNLDLLVLVSFGVSLAFFNHGRVFQAASLAALPLAYLAFRFAWSGCRRARAVTSLPRRAAWAPPVWLLAAAAVFLMGFRIGVNVAEPTAVIDVGYAGVIGADRILDGSAPYGHMPVEGSLPACGSPDADGRIRDRIQTNGRCESSNPSGDTYGPLNYVAYVPFVAALGWSGKWDELPAGRAAAIAFDLLALAGLFVAGYRLRGRRLGVTLAFAWAAYPFTAYALAANTNDALVAACLIWGFAGLASPACRGAAIGAAIACKFVALPLAPLWISVERRSRRSATRFVLAAAVVVTASGAVLLLEPNLWDAIGVAWDRTVVNQLERHSPFSPWDWGQYHARGVPDLGMVRLALAAAVVAFAGAVAFVPRRKDAFELAALSAAVLAGLQLVLTHWSYLYLSWLLPFAVMAVLLEKDGVRQPGPHPERSPGAGHRDTPAQGAAQGSVERGARNELSGATS